MDRSTNIFSILIGNNTPKSVSAIERTTRSRILGISKIKSSPEAKNANKKSGSNQAQKMGAGVDGGAEKSLEKLLENFNFSEDDIIDGFIFYEENEDFDEFFEEFDKHHAKKISKRLKRPQPTADNLCNDYQTPKKDVVKLPEKNKGILNSVKKEAGPTLKFTPIRDSAAKSYRFASGCSQRMSYYQKAEFSWSMLNYSSKQEFLKSRTLRKNHHSRFRPGEEGSHFDDLKTSVIRFRVNKGRVDRVKEIHALIATEHNKSHFRLPKQVLHPSDLVINESEDSAIPGRANGRLEIFSGMRGGKKQSARPTNRAILEGSFLDELELEKKSQKIHHRTSKIGGVSYPRWNQDYVRQIIAGRKTLTHKFVDKKFRFFENYPKVELSPSNHIIDVKPDQSGRFCLGPLSNKAIVAAMIALNEYDFRSGTALIKNIVTPSSIEGNCSVFFVKLCINGTFRQVKLDASLPLISNSPGLTQVNYKRHLAQSYNCLWPSLVEKAIMKLYNCDRRAQIDTNPAIEAYHLSGWLPEYISFSIIDEFDELWFKMKENFEEGNTLFYLQDKQTQSYYVVTNFFVNNYRFTEKKFVCATEVKFQSKSDHFEGGSNNGMINGISNRMRVSKMQDGSGDKDLRFLNHEKVIEFTKEELTGHYTRLILSWSPFIFPKRKYFNSIWYSGRSESLLWDEKYCLYNNPQFLIKIERSPKELEMRILIERHVSELNARVKKKLVANGLRMGDDDYGEFVGYKLFNYEGSRIFYSHDYLKCVKKSEREVFSDAFVFEASQETRLYCLVLLRSDRRKKVEEVNNPNDKHGWIVKNKQRRRNAYFTLGIFGWHEISILELPYQIWKQKHTLKDIVQASQCGGNILDYRFLANPFYILDINQDNEYTITAEASDQSYLMLYVVKLPPSDSSSKKHTSILDLGFGRFISSPNSQFYYMGVSQLSSYLVSGRYLVIVSFQTEHSTHLRLTVKALDQSGFSEIPNHIEQPKNSSEPLFLLNKYRVFGDEEREFTKSSSAAEGSSSLKKNTRNDRRLDSNNKASHITNKQITRYPLSKKLLPANFIHYHKFNSVWTPSTCVGTDRVIQPCYQRFFDNPGFFVQAKKPTRVIFHLSCKEYKLACDQRRQLELSGVGVDYHGVEPESLSICVVKIKKFEKGCFENFETVLEDKHYTPSSWGYWTKEVLLEASPQVFGYFVLCLNFNQDIQRTQKFQLEVFSPEKDFYQTFIDKRRFCFYPRQIQIWGSWEEWSAGGCHNDTGQFAKNPCVLINTVDRRTPFFAKLNIREKIPVGLYLIDVSVVKGFGDDELALNCVDQEILDKLKFFNQAFMYFVNTIYWVLEPGKKYMLVPATLEAHKIGDFELKMYSETQLEYIKREEPLRFRQTLHSGTRLSTTILKKANQKENTQPQDHPSRSTVKPSSTIQLETKRTELKIRAIKSTQVRVFIKLKTRPIPHLPLPETQQDHKISPFNPGDSSISYVEDDLYRIDQTYGKGSWKKKEGIKRNLDGSNGLSMLNSYAMLEMNKESGGRENNAREGDVGSLVSRGDLRALKPGKIEVQRRNDGDAKDEDWGYLPGGGVRGAVIFENYKKASLGVSQKLKKINEKKNFVNLSAGVQKIFMVKAGNDYFLRVYSARTSLEVSVDVQFKEENSAMKI